MNGRELAKQFQLKSDWSGMTPKDFHAALEAAIIATCYANVPASQHADCLAYHEDEIDFALYSMMSVVFPWSDNPEWTLKEAIRNYEKMTFESNSKRNCYVGYLNGYFYKYIHDVELHRLMMIVESNDELSLKDAVDFFITGIIYPGVIEAHPGMLVTYNMINGVQPTRIQSLQQISAELQTAYRNSDQVALFKSIYFLMTNFAGTKYRAVHRGVLMLLSIEMADFRETFYSNLPSIIENEGAVSLAGFTH